MTIQDRTDTQGGEVTQQFRGGDPIGVGCEAIF